MCHLKYLAMSCQIFYFRRFSLILWKRHRFINGIPWGKTPNQTTFLENDAKKINALLWFKRWKCFKLKLLQLKICHLYWNHKTGEHHLTSTHTSENSFLLLFGLCHLLTLFSYNPSSHFPNIPCWVEGICAVWSWICPVCVWSLTESVMTKLWEF